MKDVSQPFPSLLWSRTVKSTVWVHPVSSGGVLFCNNAQGKDTNHSHVFLFSPIQDGAFGASVMLNVEAASRLEMLLVSPQTLS